MHTEPPFSFLAGRRLLWSLARPCIKKQKYGNRYGKRNERQQHENLGSDTGTKPQGSIGVMRIDHGLDLLGTLYGQVVLRSGLLLSNHNTIHHSPNWHVKLAAGDSSRTRQWSDTDNEMLPSSHRGSTHLQGWSSLISIAL